MSVLSNFWSLFAGSPKTTDNKAKLDKDVESYANIGKETRKQIAYHFLNGTDIPALIKTAQTGIIGAGITIQSRTENQDIDNSFEKIIKEHSKKKNFEVTGRYSLNGSLEMAISEKFRKGGILVRHRYSTAWKIPYKIELIGIDRIDVGKFNQEQKIINGLRKNKDGEIVGYFIFTDYTNSSSIEISANDMSSYMDYWMDISQYTAVARLSQLLPELDDLIQYQKNELLAATDRSQGSVFWHTKMYDTVIDAMNELYKSLKAGSSSVTADNFAELTEIQRTITKKMAAEGIVPSGGVRAIPVDDTITQIDNKTSSVYEPFNENISNKLTASQNRSRVITYKNMRNTNWATINALSSIDESENATEMRKLTEDILDDWLERLFRISVQTGKIPNLTWEQYQKNEIEYHSWEILRNSRVVVDETKLATANEKNLKNRLTTEEEIYAKRNKDYKTETMKKVKTDIELKTQIKKEYEDAKLPIPEEYGINPIQQQGAKNNA